MIDQTDPQKRELARLVRRLLEIHREGPDGAPLEALRQFIENDWEAGADLSEADLGSLVLEAVMCECAMVLAAEPGEQHHADCPMWDSKEDPGDV